VDWAKKDKDSSKNASVGKDAAAQAGSGAKKEKGGNTKLAASVPPTPAVPEVSAPATPRYIPGDEEVVESPLKSNVSSKSHPSAKLNPPKNAASKKQTDTPKKNQIMFNWLLFRNRLKALITLRTLLHSKLVLEIRTHRI